MISDQIKNHALYFGVHPMFAQAFDFIERVRRESLPVGRYDLNGTALYAMVQEYDTKAPADCPFEGHRRYIDIQYILSGTECMEVLEGAKVEETVAYNDEKDLAFFRPNGTPATLCLTDGEFAVFFPHDIHRPGMALDTPAPVRKVVVKVRV